MTSFTIKSRREVDFRNAGFYTPEFMTLFIFLFISSNQFQIKPTNSIDSSQKVSLVEPDKELESIRSYMKKYANELVAASDLYRKRIDNGILPEQYPSKIRNKARKSRYDYKKWNPVMLYPTALWRTCIYPTFRINYTTWCRHSFGVTQSKLKLNGCLNNYCIVCCDHLPFIYRDIINKNTIPTKLGFGKPNGANIIQSMIST